MTALIVENRNDCITLTLNRPERGHAFDLELLTMLKATLEGIENNTRAVVLTSTGPIFSTGMDLKWIRDKKADPQLFADCLSLWHALPCPTLTVAQGHAFGGALGFIAASDIVLANKESHFQLSEIKLGLAPAMITPYLTDVMSPSVVKYLALTAHSFNVNQALRWGLVHQTHLQSELDAALGDLLAHLSSCPTITLHKTKKLIIDHTQGIENLYQTGAKHTQSTKNSAIGQEGIQGFLEKRTPNWNDS